MLLYHGTPFLGTPWSLKTFGVERPLYLTEDMRRAVWYAGARGVILLLWEDREIIPPGAAVEILEVIDVETLGSIPIEGPPERGQLIVRPRAYRVLACSFCGKEYHQSTLFCVRCKTIF